MNTLAEQAARRAAKAHAKLEQLQDASGRAPRGIKAAATRRFGEYAELCRALGVNTEEQIHIYREAYIKETK